jgi:hypothetical protein
MPVEFTLPVTFRAQAKQLTSAVEAVADPRLIARALIRGGRELEAEMRLNVSGPRPRRLDAITGELRASFETDAGDLPNSIRVGTPLFWAVFHELGARGISARRRSPGRRGRSGGTLRARPFVEPALAVVADRMPEIFVDEMERARDRAR